MTLSIPTLSRNLTRYVIWQMGVKARYANPEKALLELTAFITTLPRELKEKVKPLQDQALDSVKNMEGNL